MISAWREAYVYPIPKPKDWECDLNNTRPITLLETIRKAMVRILNNRVSKIFVQHHILKGNQFAGLPGTSTFEPLRILNEIIEDAKEKRKDIWILFQDMSKAYDRVNLFMLQKAMTRLKLLVAFNNLICNLFTNRTNRVFTLVGTTDPYDVLIGIDQGEVISPLLWCIYYDPLLCEVEKHKFGFRLNHSFRQNLYSPVTSSVEHITSSLAFMDDTTWMASKKTDLENILAIADDFNQLNNIKVNKFKSELLMFERNSQYQSEHLSLAFGNETIHIRPAKRSESIHFLGVWFNLAKSRKFVLQQATDEVTHFCESLKRKKVTDKQLLYLYNM